jgi:hypothetical protein
MTDFDWDKESGKFLHNKSMGALEDSDRILARPADDF